MNKHKEPFIHVTRRANITTLRSVITKIIAIVAALAVCALVVFLVSGLNPIAVFKTMIEGSFGSKRKFWIFLQSISILLCISLAVTPAFKMRCWNLGAEGQILAGGLAATAFMICVGEKLPNGVLIPLMLVASVAAGAIWAAVPAVFKAKFNTNETLFTLMMNYVAIQLVNFFVKTWENPKGSNTIGVINSTSMSGWLPTIINKQFLTILVAVVLTVIVYIYLTYTKHGYEIAVVGESERTAKYVGIHVGKVVIRTMLLSGAISGLVGFLLVSGINHTLTSSLAGGQGFTAVMVSWMSKFNPFIMILSSFLLIFMNTGAENIATDFGLNSAFGDILTGIIIFFIIASEFFINYKINFRHSRKEVTENV